MYAAHSAVRVCRTHARCYPGRIFGLDGDTMAVWSCSFHGCTCVVLSTTHVSSHHDPCHPHGALQELASLSQLGVQPDVRAATALVRACCRDMTLAQSVFDELFGKSL